MKRVSIFIILITILISLLFYPDTYRTAQQVIENSYAAVQLNSYLGEEDPILAIDENKIKIVFMFDDGWETVYSEAYPLFQKYDVKGSVAIIPSIVTQSEYMSYPQICEIYMQGWDILNHSYTHKEDMYDQPEEMLIEFNKASEWMRRNYLSRCAYMAIIPYGECNPFLISLLIDSNFNNIRTDSNIITIHNKKTSYYPVRMISLSSDSYLDHLKHELLIAFKQKTSVLFILHKIERVDDDFQMTFPPERLDAILDYIDLNRDKYQVVPYSLLFV